MLGTTWWTHTTFHCDVTRGGRGRAGSPLLTLVFLLHHQVHVVHTRLDVVPRNKFVIIRMCLSFQLQQLIQIPAPFPQQETTKYNMRQGAFWVTVAARDEKTWAKYPTQRQLRHSSSGYIPDASYGTEELPSPKCENIRIPLVLNSLLHVIDSR